MSELDELRARVARIVRLHVADDHRAEDIAASVVIFLDLQEQRGMFYGCADEYGFGCPAQQCTAKCEHMTEPRRYVTPWERIEEDG